jgi:hypothetical protein
MNNKEHDHEIRNLGYNSWLFNIDLHNLNGTNVAVDRRTVRSESIGYRNPAILDHSKKFPVAQRRNWMR